MIDDPSLVLVAEDDATTRTIIRRIVANLGFTVVVVPDGEMALDVLVHNTGIHMLVTDEQMPKMLGTELVTTLRSRREFDHLGIVMVSGVIRMSDVSALLDAGADRFVAKPIVASALARELSSLNIELRRRRDRNSARAELKMVV